MPHGFCYEWRPGVLWLHILSDVGTALAYYGIGFLLFYFTRQRRGLPFQLLLLLFSAFISLCGTTHLLSVWVLWHPDYYVEGAVKAVTAVVSIVTLVTLTYVLPRGLKATQSLETLVTAQNHQLAAANAELRSQIAVRESIESALRQSQKMEAIGQLTGGIAHDFNNMLQAIGGSLEMVQRRAGQGRNADAAQHIQNARTTVERAAALTNRLLAFARRQPLQPRPIHLDELVRNLEELIRSTVSTASTRGSAIDVELRLNDGGWPVLCDPNQLENAFLNVAINARDAMPQGGRLIIGTRQAVLRKWDLTGQEDPAPGDYVEISIEDNGIGMDEATQQRVFEPFFTTKPIGQGTGLGLSQVYGFARQSGGLATVQSRHGEGTVVRLFLKRVTTMPETMPETAPPTPPLPPLRAVTGATVLLVEDETVVRNITADYLRELGYNVLPAEDAQTALELARHAAVLHLLVTDVGLPNGLNGRQLAEAVRETMPDLPVLFITGYAGAATLAELEPGMRLFAKPFRLPAIAAEVAAILETVKDKV